MKTKVLYAAVLTLIISSILSSCAFMQKGEFAQRKYYNFPRTNHSLNTGTNEFTASNQQNEYTTTIAADEKTQTPEPILTASAGDKPIIVAKHRAEIKNTLEKNPTTSESILSPDNSNYSVKKSEIRKLARKSISNSNSSDADTMMIIVVIAAIFLPPLSIYIKDSGRISKWFWITLILCLLSGGIFLGGLYAGGLLWIAAIVIALMHAFGSL